ncbi:MAG: peptidoglycan DD-metalloendopeptidase family protein [Bacteroidetes bacterium]|nr:peptidoglycan DD-metalloendopeptidase family protein [Bacteroidota bacterium]
MKNFLLAATLFLVIIAPLTSKAQEVEDIQNGNNTSLCISNEEYNAIEKRQAENIIKYNIKLPLNKTTATQVTYNWPLRAAKGFKDSGFYAIYAYVDQDATSGIKDWNCGTNTYNGHKGTDIGLFPYRFYMMDNKQVEIIAAADGIIMDKIDSLFDKNCAANGLTANYVMLMHSDSSRTLYAHMKKYSLTTKKIGDKVKQGEFLGTVGSSGSSTGPHLHFEVWKGDKQSTYNDPWAGSCNKINATTWWAKQKSYTEPAIIVASVHTAAPVVPACPGTETPNEDSCFKAGGTALFQIAYRNETKGLTANMRIVNPDGSTFNSWTRTSAADNKSIRTYVSNTLPSKAGTYTFEAKYNGITTNKKFKINCSPTTGIESYQGNLDFRIYPNPSNGNLTINSNPHCIGQRIIIYNSVGEIVSENSLTNETTSLNLQLPNGLYFYKSGESIGKILIQN